MIEAVVFDFDDTLVQTFNIRVEAIQLCGRTHFNQDISIESIKAIWGKASFDDFIQRIFNYADSLENIKSKYFEVVKHFPNKLHDGVLGTLEKLSNNYKLGIVTSGTKDIISHDMNALGLDKGQFFKVQFADETVYHKPDPRVFEPMIGALSEIGISPAEVLFVGDSVVDHEAATKAGMNFLAVTTGIYGADDFAKLDANFIATLSDLESYLQRLALLIHRL